MARKSQPKWKKFEVLVADLQKAISPNASIKTNEHILGKRSGRRREVDIVIRQSIGQFELLIVIDCKDYEKPADVKDIEAFLGLVEDVGANKGAMVAATGFTQTAKRRAQDSGVDLFRLIDTENLDWKSIVAIPMVCDFRSIKSYQCKFFADNSVLSWITMQQLKTIPIYNSQHNLRGSVQSLLWEIWNNEYISHVPGLYFDINAGEQEIFVQIAKKEFFPIKVTFNIEVQKIMYFGYLPLTKITGLEDEIKGGILLPNKAVIVTDWIDPIEVEHNWQKIPSIEALAVQPFLIQKASDNYPVNDPFRV